jgi:hypothetical protein
MSELEINETSKRLRLLAKQLDEGENIPDFCFCTIENDKFISAHRANNDIFGLIGLVSYRLSVIKSEVDDY